MTDVETWVELGLYDPAVPGAGDRLALLEWLAELGLTIDELSGVAPSNLNRLAADRALRPGPHFTASGLAERAGLAVEQIERIAGAVGLPPRDASDRRFTDEDVPTFQMFVAGAEIFGEQALMQFCRVMGSSLARIAEAAISLFLVNREHPLTEADAGELALAKANLEGIEALRGLQDAMSVLFRTHVENSTRRSRESRTPDMSPYTFHLAVGFVDLVGFTPLSQGLDPHELAELVSGFEDRTFDLVSEHDGRVVKFIGDEVMFVTLTADAACEVALRLTEVFGAEGSVVTPRGGIAVGDLLALGGDYYGPVVNLASRIGELAVPFEILATAEVREARSDAYELLPAGRRLLKGFDDPVELWSLTRPRPTP